MSDINSTPNGEEVKGLDGLRPQPSPKTLEFVAKQDAALNKRLGWTSNGLSEIVQSLTKTGRVEVGWRESCGTTDPTMYTYRAWQKVIPKLKKDGLSLAEESVKHKNAWATKGGGFWNSTIYRLEEAVAA